MLIGELAKQVALSKDTIRFYEKLELIQPLIQNNGYKNYSEQDAQQLLLIQTAKNLGFTLTEIKEILDLVNITDIPAEQFQNILRTKLKTIEEKIAQLHDVQTLLNNLLLGEPCPLRKNCNI